jgi:23S rRNA (adenine2503-C2)-methyltransferase
MSGCPVGCKFCATGKMGRYRNLTGDEIVEQVEFVKSRHVECFGDSRENKINYTRMGEPFLNIDSVRNAIDSVNMSHPGVVHHYVSTIGVRGSDFSWIEGNITLQISLHSLDEERRNWLIPFSRKMSIEELGQIRTRSNLKTTVNLTLVDRSDFDIDKLRKYFDPDFFFIKISPINTNDISDSNGLGSGVIEGKNIL